MVLWELEGEIIGFFNIYDGLLEPSREGPIVQGNIKNDSLQLKVWTKQSKSFEDWDKSDVIVYFFDIKKSEDKLTGSYTTNNCSDETDTLNNI